MNPILKQGHDGMEAQILAQGWILVSMEWSQENALFSFPSYLLLFH